ncbi:hypothetical protein [Caulobacter vibrioides]|uniref:Uncharacterized protein n=1 Tax=Caulobacter vibrioides (strain NA1000 / CB15N) TaxID=565050 RepID=A0A0H3IA90_CAUVN|nr:hypothetical protein [Caulobacter vibrioides]YP_008877627.1 hypothetical protein CCNA_03907 [Caulobacter vibrioides NA1000]AGJ94626.1 hypothetical protein CCNA_03907 [Caulobacter vibrioides NA1000]QXZ51669.1 hypothetical protein KZH45_17575 [Caulobacter vibrioides]
MRAKPPDPKEQAKRAALNALKRARRAAEKSGVELSEWEGEFLTSVAQRVETYGRAFADPEKGARGQALSGNQTIKLKEIARKAKGEKKPLKRGKGFGRRGAPPATAPEDED